jgi:hypothetical protein
MIGLGGGATSSQGSNLALISASFSGKKCDAAWSDWARLHTCDRPAPIVSPRTFYESADNGLGARVMIPVAAQLQIRSPVNLWVVPRQANWSTAASVSIGLPLLAWSMTAAFCSVEWRDGIGNVQPN